MATTISREGEFPQKEQLTGFLTLLYCTQIFSKMSVDALYNRNLQIFAFLYLAERMKWLPLHL